jgi:anti-anti-sigma factor
MARRHLVVALPEQIDATNAGRVADKLTSAISQGGTVIADMSATTFCDCAGARAVVQAHKRAAASHAQLRVVVTTAQVRRLFDLLGVDRLLDIYSRPDDAGLMKHPAGYLRASRLRPRHRAGRHT